MLFWLNLASAIIFSLYGAFLWNKYRRRVGITRFDLAVGIAVIFDVLLHVIEFGGSFFSTLKLTPAANVEITISPWTLILPDIAIAGIIIYIIVKRIHGALQIVTTPDTRENVLPNLDPKLHHVSAILYYPWFVSWKKGERTPSKRFPRYKVIINWKTKKAYYFGDYSWNLIKERKIGWIVKDWKGERQAQNFLNENELKLIPKPATETDFLGGT